jgi:hypothetical protein
VRTLDCARVYLTRVPYLDNKSPLMERGWSAETEYPWRLGKCIAIRIPTTKIGFGIGLWGPEGDEEETLTKASGCRIIGPAILDDDPEI